MHKFLNVILFCSYVLGFSNGVLNGGVLANGLDDNCSHLTYKSAPIVKADQYICQSQYGVAYSYSKKTAIYTTAYLEFSDLGNLPRSNNFRPNPEVPIEYSATIHDYKNTTDQCGGFKCDRGHLNPSQDFASNAIAISESFLLTNVVPQNYKNNQVIWKYLENRIRTYVLTKNSVYVITGTAYTKPLSTIGNGVAVPDYLFKVVIDSITGKSISFLIENIYFPVGSLNGKVVPLKDIEKITGIMFDKSLDKQKSASYQEWFTGRK